VARTLIIKLYGRSCNTVKWKNTRSPGTYLPQGVSFKDASATLAVYELGENFENEFNIDLDSLIKIIGHQTLAMSWCARAGSRPKLSLLVARQGLKNKCRDK